MKKVLFLIVFASSFYAFPQIEGVFGTDCYELDSLINKSTLDKNIIGSWQSIKISAKSESGKKLTDSIPDNTCFKLSFYKNHKCSFAVDQDKLQLFWTYSENLDSILFIQENDNSNNCFFRSWYLDFKIKSKKRNKLTAPFTFNWEGEIVFVKIKFKRDEDLTSNLD
jgi:hypothetical protein